MRCSPQTVGDGEAISTIYATPGVTGFKAGPVQSLLEGQRTLTNQTRISAVSKEREEHDARWVYPE